MTKKANAGGGRLIPLLRKCLQLFSLSYDGSFLRLVLIAALMIAYDMYIYNAPALLTDPIPIDIQIKATIKNLGLVLPFVLSIDLAYVTIHRFYALKPSLLDKLILILPEIYFVIVPLLLGLFSPASFKYLWPQDELTFHSLLLVFLPLRLLIGMAAKYIPIKKFRVKTSSLT